MWPLLAPKACYGLGPRATSLSGKRHVPEPKYSLATAADSQARRLGTTTLHHPLGSHWYGRVLATKRQIPVPSIVKTSGNQISATQWEGGDIQRAQPGRITALKLPRSGPENCSAEKSEFRTCAC